MELPAWLAPTDVLPTRDHGWGPLIIRTLLLNQLIALPVALAMASVGGSFPANYAIASTYSQCIGLLCAGASMVTFPWIEELPSGRKLSAMMAHYFVGGVIGAEVARRLSEMAFPWVSSTPVMISWAVGATIAVLVGAVLLTVSQLRARVVSTELEALQARINPHFLFNTLNSIAALIREDPARAEAVTLQLSALFRYTLQAPRQGLVSLDDEMTIVRGYLSIEQERLAHRLTYEISVDDALLSVRVPALILQPLVENAIKHGVATSVAGGTVRVRGWRENGRVELSVINTGSGRSTAPGTGEGLDSIRRRLRTTFGASASVTLTATGEVTEARVSFRHEVARP
jgi:hypothetical protein